MKIELDFIPIEELLPGKSEFGHIKFVLTKTAGIDRAYLQKIGARAGWIHPFCGEIHGVTHWAEIPVIGGLKSDGK